jgi:hypothetical protein
MVDTLYTSGDSFTFGSGLVFHLWKDEYPDTFEYFKDKILANKLYSQITADISTFNNFRIQNNYSNLLNKKLNCELITNAINGRANPDRIGDLDSLMNYLNLEKNINLKYCVFQISYASRDAESIINPQPWNPDPNIIYGKDFCDYVKTIDFTGNNKWKLNGLLGEVLKKTIDVICEKFKILEEKYGTKCIFFFGNGDTYLTQTILDYVVDNPYYFEIIDGEQKYPTWHSICENKNLTLRKSLGINDDHPDIDGNIWLSNQIYIRLTTGDFKV